MKNKNCTLKVCVFIGHTMYTVNKIFAVQNKLKNVPLLHMKHINLHFYLMLGQHDMQNCL